MLENSSLNSSLRLIWTRRLSHTENYRCQKCNSEFLACLLQLLSKAERPEAFRPATQSTVSAIKSITRRTTTHNKTVGPERWCSPLSGAMVLGSAWLGWRVVCVCVRTDGWVCDHNPKNVVKIPKTLHVWSTFHMRFVLKGVVGHYLKVTGDTRSPAKRISGGVPLCLAGHTLA